MMGCPGIGSRVIWRGVVCPFGACPLPLFFLLFFSKGKEGEKRRNESDMVALSSFRFLLSRLLYAALLPEVGREYFSKLLDGCAVSGEVLHKERPCEERKR